MIEDCESKSIQMWLHGIPRAQIADELGISEGTVVNIVEKYSRNDYSLDMQRQLALYTKKTGIDIFGLASTLVFHNKIKVLGASGQGVTELLSELQKEVESRGVSCEQTVKAIADIAELSLQGTVSLNKILEEIRERQAELKKVTTQLDDQRKNLETETTRTNEALKKNRLTMEDVDEYTEVRKILKEEGLTFDDLRKTSRAINSLKKEKYSPKKIIETYSNITSAQEKLQNLQQKSTRLLIHLEMYSSALKKIKYKVGNCQMAIELVGRAIRMGLKMEHLISAMDIICKSIDYFSPDEVIEDMEKYSNLRIANARYSRDLDLLISLKEKYSKS